MDIQSFLKKGLDLRSHNWYSFAKLKYKSTAVTSSDHELVWEAINAIASDWRWGRKIQETVSKVITSGAERQ